MKTKIILLSIAIIIAASALADGRPAGETDGQPYVILTLKNRTQVKLEYDAQIIPWVSTDVRDELNCTPTHFDMANVAEVYILNEAWNTCEQRDEWLFDISFSDGTPPLRGFMEIQDTKLRGRIFPEERGRLPNGRLASERPVAPLVSDFQEVRKISFYRGER